MGAAHQARLAFGIIGQLTSLAIFLSPIQVFLRVFRAGNTLEFSSIPYLSTLLNCVFWIFYGSKKVQKDGMLVMTINGVGAVLQVIYIALFFWWTSPRNKIFVAGMSGAVVAAAIVVIVPLLEVVDKRSDRKTIMGLVCDVFCILMYASPLSVLRKVIRSKSARSLPLYFSVTLVANGAIWSLYALMPGYVDPYILIPNGLGFFFGILQVILYAVYRDRPDFAGDLEQPGKKVAATSDAGIEVVQQNHGFSSSH